MIDFKKDIMCVGKFHIVGFDIVKCLVSADDEDRTPHFHIVTNDDNTELFCIEIYRPNIIYSSIDLIDVQKTQLIYWLNSTYNFYGLSRHNDTNWERVEDCWYCGNEIDTDDGSFIRLPMPDYNLLPTIEI